jgi:hypothetical protein
VDIAERIETATLRPKKVDMEIGSGKEGNAMTVQDLSYLLRNRWILDRSRIRGPYVRFCERAGAEADHFRFTLLDLSIGTCLGLNCLFL